MKCFGSWDYMTCVASFLCTIILLFIFLVWADWMPPPRCHDMHIWICFTLVNWIMLCNVVFQYTCRNIGYPCQLILYIGRDHMKEVWHVCHKEMWRIFPPTRNSLYVDQVGVDMSSPRGLHYVIVDLKNCT